MGAFGIDEMVKWAKSKRGQYVPPAEPPKITDDGLPDENLFGCVRGWECG